MLVLGIDPGTARMGYGLVLKNGTSYQPLGYGIIELSKETTQVERLERIYTGVQELIERYGPQYVAVEELFFFKNHTTVISVAQARGVILLAARQAGLPVFECTPLQVKQGLTGYGRADKAQVAGMVKVLLNLSKIPKPDDITDALAVAITATHFIKSQKLGIKLS